MLIWACFIKFQYTYINIHGNFTSFWIKYLYCVWFLKKQIMSGRHKMDFFSFRVGVFFQKKKKTTNPKKTQFSFVFKFSFNLYLSRNYIFLFLAQSLPQVRARKVLLLQVNCNNKNSARICQFIGIRTWWKSFLHILLPNDLTMLCGMVILACEHAHVTQNSVVLGMGFISCRYCSWWILKESKCQRKQRRK